MNLKGGHGRAWAPSFDADWANSGLTRYFNTHHSEHITIVDDPILGAGRKVAKFQTLNTDIQPSPNPRTQVEPPYNWNEGSEGWMGFGLLLPTDFPLPYPNAWLNFAQLYGPPFNGSPPWGLAMLEGTSQFKIGRNHNEPIAWRMTAVKNQWIDFAFRTRMSSVDRHGFLELWLNTGAGWMQQTFANGDTRLFFPTTDETNNGGGNSWMLQNYRQVDTVDSVTVYFASHKVGRSLTEVDPHSYA